MFTTIVAGVAFIALSFLFIAWILMELFKDRKTERLARDVHIALGRPVPTTDWRKVGIFFVIWFVSGWYLFG